MKERLLALYQAGRLTEAMLDVAVTKGWITAEEKTEIIASVTA
jgi:hypothetical protein